MKRTFSISFALIILFTWILSFIERKEFLRDFLSQAYSMHLLVAAVGLLLLLSMIRFKRHQKPGTSKKSPITPSERRISPPPISLIICILWIAYLLLYRAFGPKIENYYWSYLTSGLCLLPAVYLLFLLRRIPTKAVYIPIILIGATEAIAVVMQFLQLIPSHSAEFSTTGTGTNPNIASMMMAMCLPSAMEMVVQAKKQHRLWWALVSVVFLVAMVMTQCRSGLLATTAILLLYLIVYLKRLNSTWLRATSIAIILVPILAFVIANTKKTASQNGRQTIWMIAGGMIQEKPTLGYGYGFFEKNYNLHQADYFNQAPRSREQRMNATFTNMAYNEYIEQTIMGGVIGGVLFSALLLSLMIGTWKGRKTQTAPCAGVVAFALMSMFNFTASHPLLLTLLLLYAGMGIVPAEINNVAQGKTPESIHPESKALTAMGIGILLCIGVLTATSLSRYSAQKKLTKAEGMLKAGRFHQAGALIEDIQPRIGTSEAFYTLKAQQKYAIADSQGMQSGLKELLELTSNPYLMEELAQLSERQGLYEEAEAHLIVAKGIEPHRFGPRVQLMNLYLKQKETLKARATAKEIVEMDIKIPSPKVTAYKQMAQAVLEQQ